MENQDLQQGVFAHRAWWVTKPTANIIDGWKTQFEYGSKGLSKMMTFAKNYTLTNEVIDNYMSMSPKRYDNESREDYKARLKFQKALLKYRPYIYKFPSGNKRQRKIKDQLKKFTNENREAE